MIYKNRYEFVNKYTERLQNIRTELIEDIADLSKDEGFIESYFDFYKTEMINKLSESVIKINSVIDIFDRLE